MTNQTAPMGPNMPTTAAALADQAKQILLKDVGQKWGKFTSHELSQLKNNDDLVTQVVAKYGMEKLVAQRDVDFILKGRAI
jgi:hypothetical protein